MENTITLSGDALAPLRKALYSALGPHLDALDRALLCPSRQETGTALAAYRELTAVGDLLDEMNWTHEAGAKLTLRSAAQALAVRQALQGALEVEGDATQAADRAGDAALVRELKERCETLKDLLAALPVAGPEENDAKNTRPLNVAVCGHCGEDTPAFRWHSDDPKDAVTYCEQCASQLGRLAYGEASAALRGLAQAAALCSFAGLTQGEIAHGLQLGLTADDEPLDVGTVAVLGRESGDAAWRRFFQPIRKTEVAA